MSKEAGSSENLCQSLGCDQNIACKCCDHCRDCCEDFECLCCGDLGTYDHD